MKKEAPEYKLQCLANYWFKREYPQYIFASTHNESAYRAKDKYERSGMYKGIPDVFLIIDNEVLFVEFKAPKPHTSRISEDQKATEQKIKRLLGDDKHLYCYSIDEFKDFVNQHTNK